MKRHAQEDWRHNSPSNVSRFVAMGHDSQSWPASHQWTPLEVAVFVYSTQGYLEFWLPLIRHCEQTNNIKQINIKTDQVVGVRTASQRPTRKHVRPRPPWCLDGGTGSLRVNVSGFWALVKVSGALKALHEATALTVCRLGFFY